MIRCEFKHDQKNASRKFGMALAHQKPPIQTDSPEAETSKRKGTEGNNLIHETHSTQSQRNRQETTLTRALLHLQPIAEENDKR